MSRVRQRHRSVTPLAQSRENRRHRRRAKGRPGWLGFTRKLFWTWWLWIAAAAILQIWEYQTPAIICAVVGFFFYLVAPREHIPQYGLESELAVHSHDFLTSIVGTTGVPIVKNNKLAILNNGDEFYPAMLEAIANAKHSITMEQYIYWDSEIGRRFAEALAERSQAGVEVKLLLDAVGSASIGKSITGVLHEGGCELAWYHPVRFGTLGHFNNRDHRKSLIVDGRIGFTGGAGIADHWTGNAQDPAHWREIQIRIEGPGATGLQTGFAQNWLDTTSELVSGAAYFPPCDDAGTMGAQTILSSPEAGSSAVRIMYYLSIVSAQKTVYIANPYFIPDDSARDILIDARKRGVDVKIMVAGVHNDMRISRYAGIQLYGKLLEAGVEIYEFNRTMLHQKTMVVDGVWCTVGTTNFDNRSFALDEESNICVYDARLAAQLERIFTQDLDACDPVTLDAWRQRGVKTRVFGLACVFLKEQI